MKLFKKAEEKDTNKLPMSGRVRKGLCGGDGRCAHAVQLRPRLCRRRRSHHRGKQPVRFHFRAYPSGGPDPARLGHCAGRPVLAVPRSEPAFQWLPHSCGRYHHHLCKGDFDPYHWLIPDRPKNKDSGADLLCRFTLLSNFTGRWFRYRSC